MPDNKLSVTVRMYRHGLGDCFLLMFKRGEESFFNLLIDCGIFFATTSGKKIMTEVAKSIRDDTGKHLHAVVLTHDHYDHTSGFSLAKDVFNAPDFIFDEVWVGWTEDKEHPKYHEVRDHFSSILKGLRLALNTELKDAEEGMKHTVSSLVNDFFGEKAGNLGVAGSSRIWDYLLEEKAGDVKCFVPGQTFLMGGDPGIRVYVLGPPEQFDLIESEEPPDDESYRHALRMGIANGFLAAATGDDNSIFDADTYSPFDKEFQVDIKNAKTKKKSFFADTYGFGNEENKWRRIDGDWRGTATELALWMDDFTNNTCLALAIEFVESKKVMIFPGDAQFGNWISWQKLSWEIPDGNGGKEKVTAADLLARTVFYKVGHHGSHNATLRKSGLELMNIPERDLVAMIPTNTAFAKTQGKKDSGGWKMPEEKLMEKLVKKAKGRVILADEWGGINDENSHLEQRCSGHLSSARVKDFTGKVKFSDKRFKRLPTDPGDEPLYVEYILEV